VGGAAQTKAIKSVSGTLRLSLAQYRELAAFAQFGSDLDKETQSRLNRGARLTELLKQHQYSPLSIWEQTASLLAAEMGALDSVPVEKIKEAQAALLTALVSDHKQLMDTLNEGNKPTDEMKKVIAQVAEKTMKGFSN
jgi:F-type H+-transporting ATPase subunit alpha